MTPPHAPSLPGTPVRSSEAAAVVAGCLRLPEPRLSGLAASDLRLAHALSVAIDAILAKFGLTKAGVPPMLAGGPLFVAVALPRSEADSARPACLLGAPPPAAEWDVPGGQLGGDQPSTSSGGGGGGPRGRGGGRAPPATLASLAPPPPGTASFPPTWSPPEVALAAAMRCAVDMHAVMSEVGFRGECAAEHAALAPHVFVPARSLFHQHALAALSFLFSLRSTQLTLPCGSPVRLQLGVATGAVCDGLVGKGSTLDYR